MNEQRGYRQFQPEERVLLAAYAQEGASVRESARRLGRYLSTVSRELRRNGVAGAGYASKAAQVAAMRRRIAARPAGQAGARERAVGRGRRAAGLAVVAAADRRHTCVACGQMTVTDRSRT